MLFVAALAVCSAAAADDGCDRYYLYDVHLGDSREAVAARWPGKIKYGGREYRAKIPTGEKVRIALDDSGTVEALHAYGPFNPAEIKLKIIDRLGQPTADALMVPVGWGYELIVGPMSAMQTRWQSSECNADVIMSVVTGTAYPFSVTTTHLLLVPHGGRYPDVRSQAKSSPPQAN